MPNDDELSDDQYHRLIALIGEQRTDFQRFTADLRQQQLEHWKAASGAIRTLTDWWARETDADRADRADRRALLDAQLRAIREEQTRGVNDRAQLRWLLVLICVLVIVLMVVVALHLW